MANQSNQSFVISDDEILRKNTIDTNQIEILDIVGKGNFGIVNKGKQKFSEVRPRRIYNPNSNMAMWFWAMFTFQLDNNTKR